MMGFWFSDTANRDWIVEKVSLIIPPLCSLGEGFLCETGMKLKKIRGVVVEVPWISGLDSGKAGEGNGFFVLNE